MKDLVWKLFCKYLDDALFAVSGYFELSGNNHPANNYQAYNHTSMYQHDK
jgi:hypothetical protein